MLFRSHLATPPARLQVASLPKPAQRRPLFRVPQAETPKFYRAADVFALSSDFDNSPNVLLEAMASGLPVVATDVGGVPDFLEAPAGGALVPKGDAASMGAQILELLDNDVRRRETGAFNRRQAVTKFSWRRSAEQLLAAYERAMAARAA